MPNQIGYCPTCDKEPYSLPRVKQKHPENGCMDWTNEEARAIPNEPLCVIEKVKKD